MEKNVLNTDLSGKVAVVTGASGTLCSIFAKALARAGAGEAPPHVAACGKGEWRRLGVYPIETSHIALAMYK